MIDESRLSRIDEIEIDNGRQRLLERIDEIHRSLFDADFSINAPRERRVEIAEQLNRKAPGRSGCSARTHPMFALNAEILLAMAASNKSQVRR